MLLATTLCADATRTFFDIPADNAERALRRFAAQSGLQVIFPTEVVRGVRTQAVRGEFTSREALDRMIAATGLSIAHDEQSGALTVKRAPPVQPAPPPRILPRAPSANQNRSEKPSNIMQQKNPIAFLGGLLAVAIASPDVNAQAVTPPPASPEKEEIVQLSPFEVISDTRGYYAPNTMSGTRLNAKLEDLAASISVITKEQMSDFAMLDMNDVFLYEASTEGNQTYTDFEFDRNGGPVDNTSLEPNFANRVRGINAANIARGNFETSGRVPLDPINIDAVEISRGPNANIFGLGNSSGTVNQVPSSANLTRDITQLQFRGDSFDGYRSSADLSRVLKKGTLAIRGSAVYQHTGYQRNPSGTDTVRLNGMVRFRPFKNTTLSAAFESYRIHGNTPNQTTPRETRLRWQDQGKPTFNNKSKQVRINGVLAPTVLGISTVTPYGLFNTTGSGRVISLMLVDNDGSITWWGQPEGTTTLTNPVARNQANVGFQVNTNSTIDLVPGFTVPLPEVASLYGDPGVTDQSFYDWTKHNLAAMNYLSESTRTTQIGLDQIFFNTPRQMLALQLGYFKEDSEKYRRDLGGAPASQRTVGALYIDTNEFLPDGSPNPNLLRPYVGLWIPGSYENPMLRETSRAQLAYRLDLKKEKGLLRWLGMHQLSGYAEYKDIQTRRLNYKDAMTSNNSLTLPSPRVAATTGAANNYFRFYVGDNIGQNVDYGPHSFEWGDYPYRWGTVEAIGPTGAITTPGNIRTSTGTLGPAVASGGGNNNNRQVLKTTGAVLQSYFINDRVVTTFGTRKDRSYNRGGTPIVFLPDGINIDMGRFNEWADVDWSFAEGRTDTAQVVVKPLPWLSLHAGTSNSFRPSAPAVNLFLRPVPDPTGKGNDYGFTLNLFGGKLVARFNQYENTQINARDGQAGTIGGRANQMDFNSNNISSTPFALAVQAQGWTRRAHPTWTDAQVFAEVQRITRLDAAYFSDGDSLEFSGRLAQAADVIGKGQEIEVFFNPNNYWTARFNITRQETINGQMFNDIQNYLDLRLPVWQGIIDPETGAPWWTSDYDVGTAVRTPQAFYTASVIQPLKLLKAMQGKSRPNIRKYNWRLSTNYKLAGLTDHRILKNFQVGGALRWEDKGSIGFKLRDTQTILADPTVSYLDPDRPIWDKSHLYADANVTYRTRLFANKIGTAFQLNVRNLLEDGRLQPVKANPDGAPTAFRIVDPQQFILTVTFDL